jgi:hypothetical protein
MLSFAHHKALDFMGIPPPSSSSGLVSRSQDGSSADNTSESSQSNSDVEEDESLFRDSKPETWLEMHWLREENMRKEEKERATLRLHIDETRRPSSHSQHYRSDTGREINYNRWKRWRERRNQYDNNIQRNKMEQESSGDLSKETVKEQPAVSANIKKIRKVQIGMIDIDQLLEEVANKRPDFTLRFKSNHGLGVNWMIYKGKVYVQSFSPIVVYEEIPIDISGYVVGPVESCGNVHIGDELIQVNDIVFYNLDLMQISDVVKMIDSWTEVSHTV